MRDDLVTLTRLARHGDAELFVLRDDAGYERKFTVSNAQMVTNPDAVTDAIRHVMDEYRRAKKVGSLDG